MRAPLLRCWLVAWAHEVKLLRLLRPMPLSRLKTKISLTFAECQ
jgi:hypothetical protein